MTRLLTAALLIPITWYAVKRAPFPVFVALAGATIVIAAWECFGLMRTRGSRPFAVVGTLAVLALVWGFSGLAPHVRPVDTLTLSALVVPALAMLRRESAEAMLDASVSTLFPIVFVGMTLPYAVALRAVPGDLGTDLLLLLMVCVAVSDTAAYYVGSRFGRHKLAPTVSPKKSWEGLAGGVAGSVGGALVADLWFFQALTPAHAVAIGVIVSIAGLFGDLAESMVKRAAGAKDSSSLLPGHGGMLDRVDGLLVAAPVLYYYWRFVLSGSMT